MECIWSVYETNVECIWMWSVDGGHMKWMWSVYEVHMNVEYICRMNMECIRWVYGPYTVSNAYGVYMKCIWSVLDIFTKNYMWIEAICELRSGLSVGIGVCWMWLKCSDIHLSFFFLAIIHESVTIRAGHVWAKCVIQIL